MSPINEVCIRLILAAIWLLALPFRMLRWIARAIIRGAPCVRDLPAALADDAGARAATADAMGLWPDDLERANGLWVPRACLYATCEQCGEHRTLATRTSSGDLRWRCFQCQVSAHFASESRVTSAPYKLCPVCGEEAGPAATHCTNCDALMLRASESRVTRHASS